MSEKERQRLIVLIAVPNYIYEPDDDRYRRIEKRNWWLLKNKPRVLSRLEQLRQLDPDIQVTSNSPTDATILLQTVLTEEQVDEILNESVVDHVESGEEAVHLRLRR